MCRNHAEMVDPLRKNDQIPVDPAVRDSVFPGTLSFLKWGNPGTPAEVLAGGAFPARQPAWRH